MFDAVYSDPHFGHANIIKYEERPFDDIEQMTDIFVNYYNEVVKPDHFVMWLGDCFMGGVDGASILSRLNGRKGLIRGNHDRRSKHMLEMGFDFVADELLVQIAGRICRLHHYPYWPYGNQTKFTDRHGREVDLAADAQRLAKMRGKYAPRHKGEVLIHGHTHGRKRLHDGNQIHVGVDAWHYRPVTLQFLEQQVRKAAV